MLIYHKIFLENHPELGLNKIPEGWVIHHINENHYDNEPINLQLITHADHTMLHQTGMKNCMYGKHHTGEAKRKIAESSRGRKPNLGRHHTEGSKLKLSLALKGKKNPLYGIPLSEEVRRKMSEALRGKPGHRLGFKSSDTTKQRISESKKGNTCRRKITQDMISDVVINGISKKDFCIKHNVSQGIYFTIRKTQSMYGTNTTIENYLQTSCEERMSSKR